MGRKLPGYSLTQIARAVDFTERTVVNWTVAGVMLPPEHAGPNTRYTEAHMERALEIARLRRAGMGIPAIAEHFEELAAVRVAAEARAREEAAAREVAAAETRAREEAAGREAAAAREAATAAVAPSATASGVKLAGEQWERLPLLPGLELHLRTSGGAFLRRIASEIQANYGVGRDSDGADDVK